MLRHTKEAGVIANEVFRNETITRLLRDAGTDRRRYVQVGVVIDLRGMGFRHLWPRALNCFKEIARVGDEYYPERVKRCIIIHAPLIFAKMWSIIKVFFAVNTREKVSIVSGDPTSVLNKFIDPAATPAYIKGGKATVYGDPECRALINAGGRAALGVRRVHRPGRRESTRV